MTLINEIKAVCDRLAPLGWRDLLKKVTHDSLDIEQATEAKLKGGAPEADRRYRSDASGFRGLRRRRPARHHTGQALSSLLYHALASPCVTRDADSAPLKGFPTPLSWRRSKMPSSARSLLMLASLVQAAEGKLSVVVFALEYRPAVDIPDRAHADLAFSRTGISRVGTARPKYLPDVRGFWPEDENNPNGFRVIPSRFTAWLAAPVAGSQARVMGKLDDDQPRKFWVPVHKLFDGPECLAGMDLSLNPDGAVLQHETAQGARGSDAQ